MDPYDPNDPLLVDLNPAQREVVNAPGGPLLVLAGAGSGKTRVLAHRVAHLVARRGVPPWQILAVTFTNKAAHEMKGRIEVLVGPAAARATIGTFHSVCARWLRRDIGRLGWDTNFSIYDEGDQLSTVKKLMAELDTETSRRAATPQAVRAVIARAKTSLLTPYQFSQQAETPFELAAASVYRRYQDRLQQQNALDFEDLLIFPLRLFREQPDLLAAYQQRYGYVLVDEFQDTNEAQYLIAQLLAARHRNLVVVGDDDQSIYSWRGADIRNIRQRFEEDFPEARLYKLEQNYRSTQHILAAAHGVVEQLVGRKAKRMWTENPAGERVLLYRAADEVDEARFVVGEILDLLDRPLLTTNDGALKAGASRPPGDGAAFVENRNYRHRDFAVMYRTNAQSRALEEECVRRRVPYQLIGGFKFYERREIRDLLAYFRLLNNLSDTASFERIVNVPGRGLGEKTLGALTHWADRQGLQPFEALRLLDDEGRTTNDEPSETRDAPRSSSFVVRPLSTVAEAPSFTSRARQGLLALRRLIDDLALAARELDPVGLFDLLVQRLEYEGYIQADDPSGARWENVMELRNVLAQYQGLAPGEGLRVFLENTALMAEQDELRDEADAVTLITLHAAKGLEFPIVFLVGLEEGLLPHSRALQEDYPGSPEMEEERRLCYVGMTRAMQRLYVVHCERRSLWGSLRFNDVSRFLLDLPHEVLRPTSGRAWWNLLPALTPGPSADAGRAAASAAGRGERESRGTIGAAIRGWSGAGTRVGARAKLRPAPSPGTGPAWRIIQSPAQAQALTRGPSPNLGPGAPSAASRHEGELAAADAADPRYKSGDRVRHAKFGTGEVLDSQLRRGEEEVRVRFDQAGIRLLMASVAPMDVVDSD